MSDTSHNEEAFDKDTFITKTPLNYYLTIVALPGLFIFFLILVIGGRTDIWGGAISFLFFSFIVYASIGRYLAKIKLYSHRIEVYYFFPWNSSETFEFTRLVEIEHRDMPLTIFARLYQGYQWLYLVNEKQEVCQLRYNINNADDQKLVKELQKDLI